MLIRDCDFGTGRQKRINEVGAEISLVVVSKEEQMMSGSGPPCCPRFDSDRARALLHLVKRGELTANDF